LPTSLDLISFPADVTGDEAGLEPEAALPEWSCPKCKEEVDGVLAVCWSCQTPRDSAASSPESFALDLGTWQRVFMQESGLSTASVQGSPFLGSAFATMASFITWDLHQHQAQIDWKDIAIGSLASTMLGSLAEGFFTPSRRVQSSRDRMAEALRQGVLAGDVAAQQQSYALYLRPFAVTGVFFEEEPGEKSYVPPLLPAFYARRNAEFEAVVSDIVWRLTIPLIALGRPGEAFGAGRLASSEKDWTADAAALIQGSDFLLVIPSSHEGTMWELRRILEQDILCHCIFLMPWQVKGRYSSRNWTETLAACAEIGLRLPPWESQGALFLAGRAGGWLVQQHLRELARATGMLELALLELMRRSVAEEDRPVVG
jgi:hypothetical protein